MISSQTMKYVFYPAADKAAAPTLVMLHGTGGDENDLISLAGNFPGNWNVLGVRGNVTEQGMPRFFRRISFGVFDEADVAFRADELAAFLKELAAKEGLDAGKLIAVGYSNGANIAGAILTREPSLFAGVAMWRPMQPFTALPEFHGTAPVLTTSGRFDPTVPTTHVAAWQSALQEAGYEVEGHMLASGHELTGEDIELTANWLARWQ